ncbi:vesicular inhibitory amino acid transporter [Hydra vulgaris]|uniref:vesicular inhibitory amino acid transporter n=1 Tax=Hydra vulgaris TaxID=6087 RepID=UPI001F5FCAD5|nr:vesicular inhibitory amino acid transporter-like [Hydra vulgaris]
MEHEKKMDVSFSKTESISIIEFSKPNDDDSDKISKQAISLVSLNDARASVFLPTVSLSNRKVTRSLFEACRSQMISKAFLPVNSKFSFVEKLSNDRGASIPLAMLNILPLGTSIFSMPFCIADGGYLVLLVMILICIMADLTQTLLADCLYAISPRSKLRKRVNGSYIDVARAVWGENGSRILRTTLIVYQFTGCVVNIVMLGTNVHIVLQPYTSLPLGATTVIFSLSVYPLLFIRKLSVLAYFSMTALCSLIVAIISVLVLFCIESGNWKNNSKNIEVMHRHGFLFSFGIIMLSCSTHSILPQVEGSMKNSSKINQVIHQSFFLTTILKFTFALLGSLSFGPDTQSMITLNAVALSKPVSMISSIGLIGYAIFNYPLSIFLVNDSIDSLIDDTKVEKNKTLLYVWVAVTRLVAVALSVAIAIVMPYFGVLLSIRGSVLGTFLMFVFPCYFHLKLKWKNLAKWRRCSEILLMFSGTFVGVVGFYSAIVHIVSSVSSGHG